MTDAADALAAYLADSGTEFAEEMEILRPHMMSLPKGNYRVVDQEMDEWEEFECYEDEHPPIHEFTTSNGYGGIAAVQNAENARSIWIGGSEGSSAFSLLVVPSAQ